MNLQCIKLFFKKRDQILKGPKGSQIWFEISLGIKSVVDTDIFKDQGKTNSGSCMMHEQQYMSFSLTFQSSVSPLKIIQDPTRILGLLGY